MAHPQIDDWLSNSESNFSRGKYLLDTFGRGYKLPFPASVLEAKSSYSAKKLRSALVAVSASITTTTPAQLPKPSADLPKHVRGKTAGYPPHLIAYDRSLSVYWSELNTLANKKHDLEEGDELRDLALEVVRSYKALRHKWAQLDYFAAYGQVMLGTEPEREQSTDIVDQLCEWLRDLPALIDYSRRYQKSKEPAKRAEALRRKMKMAEIAAFLKSRENAN